ncbi:hypothetical protein ACFL4L_00080 [bacterium]
MNKTIRRGIYTVFVLGLCFQTLNANPQRWVTINTINARPIAMGGAFHGVEDLWAGIHWNPATLAYIQTESKTQFKIRLNALAPAILMKNARSVDKGISPIALFMPGIIFQFNRISIGILTGEESLAQLSRLERTSWLDASHYETSRNLDIAIRMRFAPRVSMGIAIESIEQYPEKGRKRWAYRYGILVKPKPYLQVGLCYYNFDNRISNTRMNLERLPDETLNIGIAIQPWSKMLLSADIRNVSDDQRDATLEPHMGIEIKPIEQLKLRGGFFHRQDIKRDTYSTGIGMQSKPVDWGTQFFSTVQWGVDASYVWENTMHQKNEWGFLSFYITF